MYMHLLYLILYPFKRAVPEVGLISPVNTLKVVVFPAPLTPNRPKHSPEGMMRLTPLTANFRLLRQQSAADIS